MELGDIVLSEITQTQKNKDHILSVSDACVCLGIMYVSLYDLCVCLCMMSLSVCAWSVSICV